MKQKLSQKMLIVVAILSMTLLSCKKEAITGNNGNPGSGTGTDLSTGIIKDYGFVNPDAKQMTAVLTTQSFVLSGATTEMTGSGAQLSFSFYSAPDGIIPAGTYVLSTSDTKMPFTFDSGTIIVPSQKSSLIDASSISNTTSYGIVNGTIDIIQNSTGYTFNFQLGLNSDLSFAGSFTGTMQYSDLESTKK